ncbi:hypothetical protein PJE062_2704 [Pseudovibrio sp. JE062]|nr:hypothetical protein PJE062_2704 [Pseudovibrio sp. JE062]
MVARFAFWVLILLHHFCRFRLHFAEFERKSITIYAKLLNKRTWRQFYDCLGLAGWY